MKNNPERSHSLNLQSSRAPAGKDGIDAVVGFVDKAFRVYPLRRRADAIGIEDRLIFTSARIHSTDSEERAKAEKQDKSEEDSVAFKLLNSIGIHEDLLRPFIYTTLNGESTYYNPFSPLPHLYLDPKYFAGFYSDKPADQISAGLELGFILAYTNLNLVPMPRLVEWEHRGRILGIAEADLESNFLQQVQQVFSVDSQEDEFILSKELIKALIIYQGADYQPQVVEYGERILVVLPGQALENAEYILGKQFHQDTVKYLAKPILDKFLELFRSHYDIERLHEPGLRVREYLSEQYRANLERTEGIHRLMGFGSRASSFRAHANSSLVTTLIQSNNGKLKPEEVLA